MRILIIGSGGREHALAWKLAREGHQIFAAPGNPGIAQVARVFPHSDYAAVAAAVETDLTVVGPEAPLVAGVVDEFRAAGRPIIGPNRSNAQLEGSKIHSKALMERLRIPTARFAQVESIEQGLAALARFDLPVVIKADGLAAGKGVIIAQERSEAERAVHSLGPRLVIEEFLTGEEVSFIVLCDGKTALPLEATQDHKTVGDGDTGPNTGGMGAYCDGRIFSQAQIDHVMDAVIQPVIAANQFTGFLYAGLMMTASGPKVLEFNVRLGDPETQPLMHRMKDGFGEALMRAATGTLNGANSSGSPSPRSAWSWQRTATRGRFAWATSLRGSKIVGAEVFQAGTRMGARGLETAGGRVLGVTASGSDLRAAVANTYAAVGKIRFDGMHYRRDIARKGFKRWD